MDFSFAYVFFFLQKLQSYINEGIHATNIPELTFPNLCLQLTVGGPEGFAWEVPLPFEMV